MTPGNHIMIVIPRRNINHALLRVEAESRRLGGKCSEMYIQEVNVSGVWAEAKNSGGFYFVVSDNNPHYTKWMDFGGVKLKIVRGRTQEGFVYLNMYVKNLGRVGRSVGGLLGQDDHTEASIPTGCPNHIALRQSG